jgi:GTP-binding protein HflX
MAEVQRVLGDIGAADIPQVLVFNKLDAMDDAHRPLQLQDTYDLSGVQTPRLFLSARQGEGIAALRRQLSLAVTAGTTNAEKPGYSHSELGEATQLGTIES